MEQAHQDGRALQLAPPSTPYESCPHTLCRRGRVRQGGPNLNQGSAVMGFIVPVELSAYSLITRIQASLSWGRREEKSPLCIPVVVVRC